MALTRQSVLELIGSGKYHSCLFTTYSFEFHFFEVKVIRAMRKAGIKNVMVLLDAKILHNLAQQSTGLEFTHASGYTIHPVFSSGVFHPKLALFFGKKEGLLLIGSGNLTSSGLGNNDELWSTIHLNGSDSPNAALFYEAWNYIQYITEGIRGINAEKIQWIKQFTPWLADLPTTKPGLWHSLENGNSAAFFTNTDKPILEATLELIGTNKVKTITVISPYYDLLGSPISQLYDQFEGATIRCVVETRYGTAPLNLSRKVAEELSFYAWGELFPEDLKTNRLHAKLLHFETLEGEYLLMGSANVTGAAMGAARQDPINEEANLLLYRRSGNWLKDLGITLRKSQSKSLAAFTFMKENPDPKDLVTNFYSEIKIASAEIENGAINLFLTEAHEGVFKLELLDVNNLVICSMTFQNLSKHTKIDIPPFFAEPILVRLIGEDDQELARQFIQYPEKQYRYCPDPKYDKMQQVMASLGLTTDITDLLELIEFEEKEQTFNLTGGKQLGISADPVIKGETLTYEEFNKESDIATNQSSILRSSDVQIAEFFSLLNRQLTGILPPENDLNQIDQESVKDLDKETGEGAGDVDWIEQEQTAILRANKELNLLIRFLAKLLKHLESRLDPITKASSHFELKLNPFTLKDYSHLVIALQVAIHYGGQQSEFDDNGKRQKRPYLYLSRDINVIDNLKAFCTHILGNFLLLLTSGLKNYEDEAILDKVNRFKSQSFRKALFLICNVPWNEKEVKIRDLLFLNAWIYLTPPSQTPGELIQELLESFEKMTLPSRNPSRNFNNKNSKDVLIDLYTKYHARLLSFQQNMALPPSNRNTQTAETIVEDDFLFTSKVGLCALYSKKLATDNLHFTLTRPGFFVPGEENPFIFKTHFKAKTLVLTF